jgi:hypothetical protein
VYFLSFCALPGGKMGNPHPTPNSLIPNHSY